MEWDLVVQKAEQRLREAQRGFDQARADLAAINEDRRRFQKLVESLHKSAESRADKERRDQALRAANREVGKPFTLPVAPAKPPALTEDQQRQIINESLAELKLAGPITEPPSLDDPDDIPF